MNITVFPRLTFEKISRERIFQLLRVVIYTVCFTGIILHLNEHNNIFYQTRRDYQMLLVMLYFMIILFTLQRVKLFNLHSLIVTAVFLPFAILKNNAQAGMPDLLRNGILEQIVNWFALMIVTDMVATGRIRKFKDMNLWILGLYCVMVALMARVNLTGISFLFYLYVLLLFFIPVEESEWSLVTGGLLNAGVLSFLFVMLASIKLNPHIFVEQMREKNETGDILDPASGGRWFGYFLNIGTFGQFLALQTGIAFLSIIRAKDRFGRFGLVYCLSFMYLAAVIFVSILVGTSDYTVGVIFLAVIVLVFGFKKTEHPRLLLRAGIMLCILLIAGFVFLNFLRTLAGSDFDKKVFESALQKTPLRFFPSGMNTLIRKMEVFHKNPWKGDAFFGNPLLAFFNSWGSSRPGIWREYAMRFSFTGSIDGVMYGTFNPMNAHSGYVQVIYNFGYLAGGMNILFYLTAWIASIVGYVKSKKEAFFVPMVLLTLMLGMWTGEMSNITFAMTVIPLVICVPAISSRVGKKEEDKETSESEAKAGYSGKRQTPNLLTVLPVLAFSVLLIILTVGLVKRIRTDFSYNNTRGEELFVVNDEMVTKVAENGLISSSDVRNGNTAGVILADAPKIMETLERTYWGEKEYARFSFDGVTKNNLMILEFSAACDQPEPVILEVVYNGTITQVEVNKNRSKYFLPLIGGEDKNIITMQFETVDNQAPMEIGDLCLVDYGKETFISLLKTGTYLADAYDMTEKTQDDVFAEAHSVITNGEYLYVIQNGELTVYPQEYTEWYAAQDSEESDKLKELYKVKALGDTWDATLSKDGKTLVVFSRGSGAYFVDTTNPAEPVLISRFDTSEWCLGGDLYGDYAFLCNRYFGIEIVDISDLSNPRYVTKVQFPNDADYRACRVYDGFLYATAVSNRRVDVYDVRDLSAVHGTFAIETDGNPMGIYVQNETLYVATARGGTLKNGYGGMNAFHSGDANGMEIYDISAPEAPKLLSRTHIDGRYNYFPNGIYDITVKGRYAYVSLMCGGLWIFDVSNPESPVALENINIVAEEESFKELELEKYYLPFEYWFKTRGSISHAAVGDGKVYCLASDLGLFEAKTNYTDKPVAEAKTQTSLYGTPVAVTEVGTPDNVEATVANPGGTVYSVAGLEDGKIVAACGEEGIKVLTSDLSLVCSASTMGTVKDVKVRGNMIYAVESPGTLRIYRYESSILTQVGEISDGNANAWYSSIELSPDGKAAVIQAWNGTSRFVDLRDPASPAFAKNPADKGTGTTYGRNMCIGLVKGKYIGIAGSGRINWFYEDESKVASGSKDDLIRYLEDKSELKMNEWNGFAAFGENCIMITDNGYRIFDPESGKILTEYEDEVKDNFKGKCAISGNLLILSRSWEGRIRIFDLSSPAKPSEVASFDTDYTTDVPCVIDGSIYIPLRHDGLMKVEIK